MIERTVSGQYPGLDESTTTLQRLTIENTHLRRKLQTLPVIEQAKGILMVDHDISADDAFHMLCKQSQDTNTKLYLVAQAVIAQRSQDHDPTAPQVFTHDPAAAATTTAGPEPGPTPTHSLLMHPPVPCDEEEHFAAVISLTGEERP